MPKVEVRISTRLQRILEEGSEDLKYDANACRLLGEPMIIAVLVKSYVPQFKDLPLGDIVDLMVGAIELEAHAEIPGVAPWSDAAGAGSDVRAGTYLASSSDTDKSVKEGSVAFDVKVHLWLPGTKKQLQVIINVEAQKHGYPWKRIASRLQYNIARMVSSEHEHEFTSPEYEKLVPVYSIWVMPQPPKNMENKVLRLNFSEHPDDVRERLLQAADSGIEEVLHSQTTDGEQMRKRLGAVLREAIDSVYLKGETTADKQNKKAERDFRRRHPIESLLNGVIVWLGPPDKAEDAAMRCLDVLFTDSLRAKEKGDILQEEFDIPKTRTIESELNEMSGLGAAIRLESEHKTKLEVAFRFAREMFHDGLSSENIMIKIGRMLPELSSEEAQEAVEKAGLDLGMEN